MLMLGASLMLQQCLGLNWSSRPMMDGASIFELIDQKKPRSFDGSANSLAGLLQYLNETNQTLDSVTTALVGGSAAQEL
ncbi:MAG: hypothetical protein Ct9H300mP20_19070 [Gammaproteobacteria bacterium]|nr:MAG: hypothetical protein Ct9H300mP20_19070 [Gammaproteobacteria bacterium]